MSFLQEKVERNDLIRVVITGSPAPQQFTAIVEEVYSARVFDGNVGSEIRFVGKPTHWGQRSLAVGQRALLFISRVSGRWYEDAWEGDLPIEEIDGSEYALRRQAARGARPLHRRSGLGGGDRRRGADCGVRRRQPGRCLTRRPYNHAGRKPRAAGGHHTDERGPCGQGIYRSF